MMRWMTILFIFLSSSFLRAQDIHFSQYEAAPHFMNPATMGAFKGSYRVALNNRDQWGSIGVPFRTAAASLDFAIPFRYDLMGVGIATFQDRSGQGGLQTTTAVFSTAYHIALGYDGINDLAFGFNTSYTIRSVILDELTFPNQYNGNYFFDPSASNSENFGTPSLSNLNCGVGVHWFYTPEDEPHFFFGMAFNNLLGVSDGFFQEDIARAIRTQIHGGASYHLDKDLKIKGKFNYYRQGRSSACIVGLELEKYMVRTSIEKASFFGGLFYRLNDAVVVLLGADVSNMRFAISYDVTVSTLVPANNYLGGAELSFIYKGRFKSTKGFKCPKFDPTF